VFPTDDLTTTALSASMRGLGLRHQALAQNVANADTPGYRRVDVQFEGALAARGRRLGGGDLWGHGLDGGRREQRDAR
jgi:flagellar basal-body rod protein FlgB